MADLVNTFTVCKQTIDAKGGKQKQMNVVESSLTFHTFYQLFRSFTDVLVLKMSIESMNEDFKVLLANFCFVENI